MAKLKSLYVEGGSVFAPVTGFLAWAEDRMVRRVSVIRPARSRTACASDRAAVRLDGRVGFRPKGVTLEMPL
jgi:hypothetical protein